MVPVPGGVLIQDAGGALRRSVFPVTHRTMTRCRHRRHRGRGPVRQGGLGRRAERRPTGPTAAERLVQVGFQILEILKPDDSLMLPSAIPMPARSSALMLLCVVEPG